MSRVPVEIGYVGRMSRTSSHALVDPLARSAGAVLAATAGTLGKVLHRIKPLHPDGTLTRATVAVVGASQPTSGVPWIDEPADHPAVVRRSRAIGLPHRLPDIAGLALRVELEAGPADLLLASTGTSGLGRFMLTLRRPGRTGALTSLLPYRGPSGSMVLCAVPVDERTYELLWAEGTGPWRTFALLHLGAECADDEPYSFDPVLNTFPGLEQYPWVRRLREPAYRTARHQSDRPAASASGLPVSPRRPA